MEVGTIIHIVFFACLCFMFMFFKNRLERIESFYKDTLCKSCQKNNYDIECLNVRITLLEEALEKLNKKKK